MRLAALWLVLIGQGGTETAGPAVGELVGHRVRVVEMQGLGWRSRLHPHLRPVARKGGGSVWLLPESELAALDGEARHAIYTPRPRTGREITAESVTILRVPYLAHLERVADGPYGLATAVGYRPVVDYVDESLDVDVDCYAETGGARVEVAISETRLAAIESYPVTEIVLSGPKSRPGSLPTMLKGHAQVPVMIGGRVEGAWSVPAGQVLVVGLGPHEMKRADGSRVLSERVAVIDPEDRPVSSSGGYGTQGSPGAVDGWTRQAGLIGVGPQAMTPQAVGEGREPRAERAPAPIGEAGQWTRREPANVALRSSEPRTAAGGPMVSGAGNQPVVIQTPGPGATIIIVPGAGPVNVLAGGAETGPGFAYTGPGVGPALPAAGFAMPPVRGPMMAAPLMPELPSRMLPTPRNAAGQIVPLPPLPDGEPHEPVNEAGEPVPTPQIHRCPARESGDSPTTDAEPEDVQKAAPPAATTVAARPEAHFSIALGAVGDEGDGDGKSELRLDLGGPRADGWRAAAPEPRDGEVERTALQERRGRLSVSLQMMAPVPTAEVTGERSRFSVPAGPFRVHVELERKPAAPTR
ncbi:MAG: hypothetical protein KatS3mg108_1523 [Isosphaeraceae bacterium]|jgi:hypothetical protein|nr:MAG: hypothetical protein KatS3mg108_1523 [Isosphaeraceae bacterium]